MEKLFVNAKFFTSDAENKFANAMATEDGFITWIGDLAKAPERLKNSKEIERIDLGGRTAVPGFIDAHMHPMMLAEYSRQIACLPPNITSIAQLSEAIAERAKTAGEGEWICGWGYDEGKYSEKRSPNRYDLDKGSADKPVFLVRSCEHIRCVNSKALEIAGITKDTPDPQGGSIGRDENGEPNGILKENARDLVIPFMPEETEEEMVENLVELGKLLSSQGIVAVADMGNLHPGGNLGYYQKAAAKGFAQRVTMYYMWDYFMDDPDFDIPKELLDHDAKIRIAGLKLIGDGSISGKTAWLHRPYLGTEECGMPVYSDESLESAIKFAKEKKCQISVHAMGGRAIDRLIGRMKDEEDWTDGKAPFLRIEHLTEPSDEAMEIAARKGFAFATQPIFEYCEIETYKNNMDAERLKTLYPIRTEMDRGVKICISTDAPATSWAVPSEPFSNIKSAVTRRAYDGTDIGQDQRIDMETAIMLYTKNAAEICGFGKLGMLKEGYHADFAVLDRDIFSIPPEDADKVKVESTYMDAEKVFSEYEEN